MNDITVHAVPGSPYARSVLIALEEKGAKYRVAPVAPGSGRTPSHLALHPFGRVPVFEHGPFRLYETQAILRYIDRILATPPLTPTEPQLAARMDQVMNVNDWYLFQGVANVIVFQRLIRPRMMGLDPDEEAIAAALPKAHVVFGELARLLGEQPFFAGPSFSLADVLVAPQLDFFQGTPEWSVVTAQHANIRAWLARMTERPSVVATTRERVLAMAAATWPAQAPHHSSA